MSKTRDLANLADLNFDSGTMVVDKVNDRVGVLNATPAHPFQVGTDDLIVDASGNVLVGTTDKSTITQGVKIRADGDAIAAVADGGVSGYFGRLNSDGEIVRFRKDSGTVGSIGTSSGSFYVDGGSGVSGVQFGVGDIRPRYNGALVDGSAADLGHPSNRWQNLYLSGGVYLGGTGSANKLDDYEEGTFTPTIGLNSGGTTVTYAIQFGFYTKIGNIVHALVRIENSSHNSTTSGALWRIGGLPFTVNSSDAGGYFAYNNSSANIWGSGRANDNGNFILIYGSYPSSSSSYITITYRTNS